MRCNKYESSPEEFTRVKNIILAGILPRELLRFFAGLDAYAFAKVLGLQTRRKHKELLCTEIIRFLKKHPDYTVKPPEPATPPKPTENPDAPICDCSIGGKGQRWKKAERGEAVTLSVDFTNRPESLERFTLEVLEQVAGKWAFVCGIKFKVLTEGVGDIHFRFSELDRVAGRDVLGMSLSPRNKSVMFDDEDAGEEAGDIFIDTRVWDWLTFLVTLLHEIGHSVGISHLPDPRDIMYEAVTRLNANRSLSSNDKAAAVELYPLRPEQKIV